MLVNQKRQRDQENQEAAGLLKETDSRGVVADFGWRIALTRRLPDDLPDLLPNGWVRKTRAETWLTKLGWCAHPHPSPVGS